MTKLLMVFLITLFIASSASADQPKVYSNEDLGISKSNEKSNSDETYRQKSSANENSINEYNLEEKRKRKVEQEEQLKEDYCRRGDALRNKIELCKKDVQASRFVSTWSVSAIGFDENFNRYKEALVRLKGAEMELRALEDELHRKRLPVGWASCR